MPGGAELTARGHEARPRDDAVVDGALHRRVDVVGDARTDRTRVVNYAQWDSAADYQAMLSDPTAREHMATAAAMAVSFDPHLYTVESVHER